MQFLKTLFWVVLAVFLALFASRNWSDVTLNLWGDIQLDIKIPLLLGVTFLLGFLPTLIVQRAHVWTLRRRVEAYERTKAVPSSSATTSPAAQDETAA